MVAMSIRRVFITAALALILVAGGSARSEDRDDDDELRDEQACLASFFLGSEWIELDDQPRTLNDVSLYAIGIAEFKFERMMNELRQEDDRRRRCGK
jgi:hypothetical protein